MKSKIIIMLTHNDKTVKNAIEIFQDCRDLPVKRWGFKNVGLKESKMMELITDMKAAGKETFLEVVTYSEEECMAGAKLAVGMGFDYLMGTVYYESVFAYLSSQNIKFLPFCGRVHSSPSILEGNFEEIIAQANALLDKGVFGIDLLAFRHKDGEKLARAYCSAIKKPVVIAGSVNSRSRIDFIKSINPWGFTMGSALFEGNFAPDKNVRKNLEEVISYMDSIGRIKA